MNKRIRRYTFQALMDRLCCGVWCVMESGDDFIFVTKAHRDYGRSK